MPPTSQLPPSSIASMISRSPKSITYPMGAERASYIAKVTPFQWTVYDVVKQIPPGSVSTYGEIARHLDTSPRAVGNALRRNPFCPLVPCHRVVASNGQLGGFFGETNGEGINTKVEMLRREGVGLAENPKGGYLIAREELEARLWIAQP